MATEMKRSRAQVLRGFLPMQTFEHPNETIVRVLLTPCGTADVNRDLLMAALDRELEKWTVTDPTTGQQVNHAQGFMVPVRDHLDDYAAVEPGGPMLYKTWPLVLHCTRRGCEKAVSFKDEATWGQVAAKGDPAVCDRCKAPRRQFPYLLVHQCGRDREIVIPPCPDHGYEHVFLYDTHSFETATWRCRAKACGASGAIGKRIAGMRFVGCGCSLGGSMRHVTMRQDLRFITHTLKLVNFEPAPMIELSQSPGSEKVVVGSYLEYFSTDWQRALAEVDKDREKAEQQFARVKQLMEADGDSPEAIAEMRKTLLGEAGTAFDDIVNLAGDQAIADVGADQKARERTLIWGEAAGLSVWRMDKFEQAAVESGRTGARQVIQESRRKLGEYGFSDLLVIDNFPVALAAFGYSRIYKQPDFCFLRAFPPPTLAGQKIRGKTPIYCSTTTTEAVFLELDAERVIAWLVANGLVADPVLPDRQLGGGLDRRRAAKSFMLRQMQASIEIKELCFALQHTIAHALIKNLGERSGFGEDTMSEYLMPSTLTIGLFADVHQELSLGALVALVEHRLGEWLDATSEGARDCQWDPHCGQHEGACMACLHLAFGCEGEHNQRLDRATLFGSPENHEPVIAAGYWECLPELQ